MSQMIFESADALGAATARLSEAERGLIMAVPKGDGRYEVIGDDAALAALAAPPRVDVLRAYAAEKRWRVETGGTMVGGVPIATDDRSKMMIIGASVAAATDPNWSTTWMGADGVVYSLDAATMIAIGAAVQAHVNAVFAVQASLLAGIAAGTISDFAGIDAADWPA